MKGACVFYLMTVAYDLMLKSDILDFVKVVIHFESLGV